MRDCHVKYRVDPDISIELGYVGVARHLDRQQMECFMTMLLRLCRQLSGVRLVPSRLRLVHRSDNERSEFAAYFGGNVDFSAGVDELTFAQKTRDMVVVSADRRPLLYGQREYADQLSSHSADARRSMRVISSVCGLTRKLLSPRESHSPQGAHTVGVYMR
jgi:hypothetical protein